jgi:hypothetical protein
MTGSGVTHQSQTTALAMVGYVTLRYANPPYDDGAANFR